MEYQLVHSKASLALDGTWPQNGYEVKMNYWYDETRKDSKKDAKPAEMFSFSFWFFFFCFFSFPAEPKERLIVFQVLSAKKAFTGKPVLNGSHRLRQENRFILNLRACA